MVRAIIRFSAHNRVLVLLATACAVAYGLYTLQHIPVDAIPDLSDTQVIVYSRWDRSPDIVEDQVTYPIVSALLGTPKVKTIRGFSDFGFSYVYVIFEDGTDIYWARSRVLEYLSKIQPAAAGRGQDGARARRDRRRLGLPVRPRRRLGHAVARRPAHAAGLEPALPRAVGARRGRGRVHRRLRPAVPGDRRPEPAAGLRPRHHGGGRGGEIEQQRGGRPPARVRGPRVHGARPRLREVEGRPRTGRAQDRPARHARPAARRRVGGDRPRDAPRHRGSRRPGRVGRRHRRHAPRGERARGHPAREGAPEGARAVAARRRPDRDDLRPLGPDRPVDRHAPPRTDARDRHRQSGDPDLPVAHPVGDRAHHHHPGVGAAGVHPDAADGHLLQHHVARGHRHLDRRPRGRRDRGGRERLQAARAVGTRRAQGRLPRHPARGAARSRAVGVLLAARDRGRVPADLHAGRSGGAALHAARVDEEPRDVHRGAARLTLDPALRMLFTRMDFPAWRPRPLVVARRPGDRRAVLPRGAPPHQPRPLLVLRARVPRGAAVPEDDDRGGAARRRQHDSDLPAARPRVHAAAERGLDSLHADDAARHLGDRGRPAAADAGSDPEVVPRGRHGVRQGRPGRDVHRPGAVLHDGNDGHPQAARRSGATSPSGTRGARPSGSRPRSCAASGPTASAGTT